jgi:hypothetical protein
VRPWLAARGLEDLNRFADAREVRTESGKPVRFVPPRARDAYYEVKVHETGQVETRPDNTHDFFNALAWLAFPRTKARINALHAAQIPRESGRRGPLRDLLTVFDEGGAIVRCDDAELIGLLRRTEWKSLFWENRERVRTAMRLLVFGHATMDQALAPWPGITCKALVMPAAADPDAAACEWLAGLAPGSSPRVMPPLPVFGYPGWSAQDAGFYEDPRYFRTR